ncbi:MATH domain-containing protein [Ditylenchus destructor]|uniref:MATH domain-containing protein n=1 Tax=Ditylenchus destructor TaxID=166010 RepID=A0AAD4MFY4_9BILA|nr:MATH domain-containing protein [Ditylenchus destructor]
MNPFLFSVKRHKFQDIIKLKLQFDDYRRLKIGKGQMKRKSEPETETMTVVPKWKPERQILMASEIDDKGFYKYEGSIEMRIDRFAEFVRDGKWRWSAPVYIRGLPWQILAYSKEADQSNNQDEQSPSKNLQVYLYCNKDSTNPTWECQATYALRVVAQKDGVVDIHKNATDNFTGKFLNSLHQDNWGFIIVCYFVVKEFWKILP